MAARNINAELITGIEIPQPDHGENWRNKTWLNSVAVTLHGDIAVTDRWNRTVSVIDRTEGRLKAQVKVGAKNVALLPNGCLAVTCSKDVKLFTPDLQLISSYTRHLKSPLAIATNSKGDIIVSDYDLKCVFVYDSKMEGVVGKLRTKDGQDLFKDPRFIAVNSKDDILVSDAGHACVKVFDSRGSPLYRYGRKGTKVHEFTTPTGVCVDDQDRVIIADAPNHRIHVVAPQDKLTHTLLRFRGGDTGPDLPHGMAFDQEGNLLVAEWLGKIMIYRYFQNTDLWIKSQTS